MTALDAASTPAPARRGRPRKGSQALSRQAIVDATLAVIATDGVDAIGMRAVARRLGVDAKSLYNHVDGKEGLLDAVAESVLADIELPTRTGDVAEDLRAIAYAFRRSALANPRASALVLTRQLASFEGLAPVDAVLSVLVDAGCAVDEAVHLLRMLVAAVIGLLLREVSAGPTFGSSDEMEIEGRRDELAASGLARVEQAADALARFDGAAEFEYSVNLVVAVVVSRLG